MPVATINGPTTICAGLQATLTAGGGGTYTWANGLGSNSTIQVSPTVNTTYTVTVTSAANCSASATQTISVTSTPVATISGVNEMCIGENVTLTANGGNTYQWSAGLGTTASVSVSPVSTTTYTVTATIGANCSATAGFTVIVHTTAQAAVNKTICSGGAYAFNGVQLTQAGIYRDTLQTIYGCDSVVILTLSVQAPLTGSYALAICAGESVSFNGLQLTANGSYADTLQTAGGCDSIVTLLLTVNNHTSTVVTDTICDGDVYLFGSDAISAAGTYTDTLTNSTGCDSVLTLHLAVRPLPVPTIMRSGDTLYTQSFASYQWLLNGNLLSADEGHLLLSTNGLYAVVVTDANGCSDTSAVMQVTGVGIAVINNLQSIRVYPNPNCGVFSVEFANDMPRQLQVTDATGKLLLRLETDMAYNAIDLGKVAAGVYFLTLKEGSATKTVKLTVLE